MIVSGRVNRVKLKVNSLIMIWYTMYIHITKTKVTQSSRVICHTIEINLMIWMKYFSFIYIINSLLNRVLLRDEFWICRLTSLKIHPILFGQMSSLIDNLTLSFGPFEVNLRLLLYSACDVLTSLFSSFPFHFAFKN